MHITNDASWTHSRGLSAAVPPIASSFSRAMGLTSKPVTANLSSSKCVAIPMPMAPRPMKAIFIFEGIVVTSLFVGEC
ncbi:hypothetical protein VI817_006044 [Penicillium citrinum]|nr:hypothetical protein VI817_006044 [Penicillium citrinum]